MGNGGSGSGLCKTPCNSTSGKGNDGGDYVSYRSQYAIYISFFLSTKRDLWNRRSVSSAAVPRTARLLHVVVCAGMRVTMCLLRVSGAAGWVVGLERRGMT